MKISKLLSVLLIALPGFFTVQTSCTKKNEAPMATFKVFPSTGSTSTLITIDASESSDQEDDASMLKIRVDWENDGVWETDWTVEKNHQQIYTAEGDYVIRIEVMDMDGEVTTNAVNLKITNSSVLIPATSPFSYNVGINYETWTVGRTQRNIDKDLDTITKYFKLIKTFHTAAVGTTNVIMDPTQKTLVDYFVAHESEGLEMAMGTNNSALGQGGYGTPWSPGLMTTKAYTDEWVQMVIDAFGSAANVSKFVKVILLGNEVDQNGPPQTDPNYTLYYTQWIPQSFENLKNSLKSAGLESIPVSTTIASYPQGVPAPIDSVQTHVTKYITENWSQDWNSGKPFILFNDYTEDYGKSTDFGPVISYFEKLDQIFNSETGVYVGETGYSAETSLTNQVKVIEQVFSWLESQHNVNNLTIPLFVFQAFDRPDKGVGQKQMGIFKDDSNNNPLGLKDGISVPAWVRENR